MDILFDAVRTANSVASVKALTAAVLFGGLR